MDFGVKNLWLLFEINGTPVYVTETVRNTWIIMAVLIILAIIVRIMLNNFKTIPRGFQNLIETAVESMDNFTLSTMGERFKGFGGYFFTMFSFILISNYIGLTGLRNPTGDLATTLSMAITVFIVTQYIGIKEQKLGYLKSFFEPVFIFFPINLIGLFADPISLAFRLFGNVLSGIVIMGLFYGLVPVVLRFIVPVPLHAYFDIFSGTLQAFIFTILSMTYIANQAE